MTHVREQRGQAMVLTVIFIAALLGFAALVLDVGSWYRAQRDLQAVADAAALAGAQALPEDPGQASAIAADYAKRNGGPEPTVSFSSKWMANDTIHVAVSKTEPGFFAKVFGIGSADIGAKASARTGTLGAAQYAAPFGVHHLHPMLQCKPNPCEDETTLELNKVGPGAFRILNLDGSKGGTGQQILAEWIRKGYSGLMPLGDYLSDSGAKFNASEVKQSMIDMLGEELLFPVYDETDLGGANFEYNVIGWAGFVVTDFKGSGNSGTITGHFTRFIAQGIQGTPPSQGFNAWTVELIE